MYLDDDGNMPAMPVILVDPSGTTTARAQRGIYFDRNPLTIAQNYVAAGVGAHGLTTRTTYICPPNRLCQVNNIAFQGVCDSIAAIGCPWIITTRLTVNNAAILGQAYNSLDGTLTVTADQQNSIAQLNFVPNTIINSGDILNIKTILTNPGGATASFTASWNGTEFDF